MDCLATSSPRSSEESIHSPRSKKTDISSENKPKWLQFVKEDGDIPVHSLNSSQFSGDTIKSLKKKELRIDSDPDEHKLVSE
jgi:hypothetical protein